MDTFIVLLFHTSGLQDDFLVIHVQNDYDSILESVFKTEFLTLLAKKYEAVTNRKLKVDVNNRWLETRWHLLLNV